LTAEYALRSQALPRRSGLPLDRVQAAAVWLMMALSFTVRFEPAPSDILFAAAVFFYLAGGLNVTAIAAPLIVYLVLYNLGAFFSYLQVMDQPRTAMFVITSVYMAVSAVFFCFYVSSDTERRFAIFKNGYIIGAVIASIIALIGYFNVGGTGAYLSPIFRAQGLFKDPNVLSTYIILPALLLTQDVMLGTKKWRLFRYIGLFIVLACLFLAFSRGAWMNFMLAVSLMVALTFTLTPSRQLRSRIILLAIAGIIGIVALLAALLSIDTVGAAFQDRATLAKDYDSGEFGRFGNQLNAIPLLLELPLGFGPLQFGKNFGLDPHNVYLNAFSSYGWLGGITYMLMILSTIIVGFKGVLIRTPWQGSSIALFCTFFATALQGIQIDTDHWRHFYWMLGLTWGLYAASAAHARKMGERKPTRHAV
jgi:hypothetical protein